MSFGSFFTSIETRVASAIGSMSSSTIGGLAAAAGTGTALA